MTKNTIKKIYILVLLLAVAAAVSFYFLGGDQLKYKEASDSIVMQEADSVTEEIIEGRTIEQDFVCTNDRIDTIAIVFTKFYRQGSGKLTIELYDKEKLIARKVMDVSEVPEQHRVYLNVPGTRDDLAGKRLTLRMSSDAQENQGVAVMMNHNDSPAGYYVLCNGRLTRGILCFSVTGRNIIKGYEYYWPVSIALILIIGLYLLISYRRYVNKNRVDYLINAIQAVYRYRFLISQLVSRDFKSKYKRSILGVFWSFLNPLLTMMVQFLVFSTFFKADTKNYAVYLLSGVVCFNFFKETTDMCLISISGNARLINKVYIPKYIFPLAKTISATINLGMSLIPLFFVSLLMGITLHKSVFLILFFLLCLIVFSLGCGMILATLMVFFRDIQFLWGVIIQIWQYATPIFYPAEIIPEKYRFIVRFNPLYHFIGNLRKCLIDGISPEPLSYLYCIVFAVFVLFLGSYVFKKAQDSFTLYL